MLQRLRSDRVLDEGSDLGEFSALVRLDMALAAREELSATLGFVSSHPLERLVGELSRRALEGSSVRLTQAFEQMFIGNVTPELILDAYLPAVARRLGSAWNEDEISWTDVTIACSRLQAVLHRIDPIPEAQNFLVAQPNCLVALPTGTQHTLGAMVYASQLRRQGLHVQVELDLDVKRMHQLVAETQYNAIFLSASQFDDLEVVSGLVQSVKCGDAKVPVVVGGSALEVEPELCSRIGADFATADMYEALNFCELSDFYLSKQGGAFRAPTSAPDSRPL